MAGLPMVDSIKASERVSGLKRQDALWDLPCLECRSPTLRLLRFQFLAMRWCPAQCMCNHCESVHLVKLVKKGINTFQVLVHRDYREQSTTEVSPIFKFERTRISQTQWKRRKPSKRLIEQVHAKGKGKCLGCGCKLMLKDYGMWHIDHNIPISRQGSNDLKNLIPLCAFCNSSKHDSTLREFKAGKCYQRGSELF
jgi:hypothetical protein